MTNPRFEPDRAAGKAAGEGQADSGEAAPESEPTADGEFVEPDENGEQATHAATAGLTGLEQLLSDDFGRISAERDEYLASLQRLQADFDNYRKRAMRQQTEFLETATERVLSRLLPVLDAFDLALAHTETGSSESDEAGSLAQVDSLLRDILGREGLARIDAVDVPFDPTVHDAVAHEDREGGEDAGALPEVAQVMRAGYLLNGKVIRPAMVKVRG